MYFKIKSIINQKKHSLLIKVYFFLFGLNFLELHFLHLTFPRLTFKLGDLIFDLQFLHTKTFFISLFAASSNFAIYLTCLITFIPIIIQYKTSTPSLTSSLSSSGISKSKVSKVSVSITLAFLSDTEST